MTTEEEQPRRPIFIPDVGRIDPRSLGGRATNKEPDYIPFNTRGRDFMGRLFFNTGVCWLGGFGGGSGYGFVEGWRSAANPNMKIRFNSVMNAMSRRGSIAGNSLGIIGEYCICSFSLLCFSFSDIVTASHITTIAFYHTCLVEVADQLQLENITGIPAITPAFAGFATGGLYKCTAGVRGAALAATIGSVVSCVYWYGGSWTYNVLLGRGGRY